MFLSNIGFRLLLENSLLFSANWSYYMLKYYKHVQFRDRQSGTANLLNTVIIDAMMVNFRQIGTRQITPMRLLQRKARLNLIRKREHSYYNLHSILTPAKQD